jgi:predicted Zn-dependent peptidase
MEFKKKILNNGLTIIGEENHEAKSAAVGFFVKTGSRDESLDINGVSHFLEHMLFKGTDNLGALEVNEAFDRTGAKFNAFTSEEMTVYYAAILPEYLGEVTQLWGQLMRPSLRDDDFQMEKNVIMEEIAMYKDMPHFDVMDMCKSLYFDGHPCGYSVLGSVDSIKKLSAEQMREYFSRRYVPGNIVAAVSGKLDFDEVCRTIQQTCQTWQEMQAPREISDHIGKNQTQRICKDNLVCEHLCLMSRCVAVQDNRRFAAAVLASIIGDSVGSRFFWELVDKAIAETASMHANTMDGTGAFYSYIRCPSENVDTVMDILRGIFSELDRNGVSEQELTSAKNKILSELVIKNELPMGRLLDLGFNWMYLGEYRRVQDDISAIKAVSVDQVNGLIREMNPGDFTLYCIGPAN